MNQKNQTSKQFSIINRNRHEAVPVFWLSQSKRGRIFIGRTLSPQQQLALLVSPAQQTHLPTNAVLACLSVNGVASWPHPAIKPAAVAKGVKRGAKQRLWDRPFCRSKLKQQGSPTIFAGQARPIIYPHAARRKRQIDGVVKPSQRSRVRTFPHFQRGNHER